MEAISQTISNASRPLFHRNVLATLLVFLTLYGRAFLPQPCATTRRRLRHPVVQFVLFWIVLYAVTRSPAVALASAGSLAALSYFLGDGSLEFFQGPKTMIHPGCTNTTVFDLLESFGNDKEGLLAAMVRSRVPADVKLNDDYAPLIATYLMYFGYKIKSPCEPHGANQKIPNWI